MTSGFGFVAHVGGYDLAVNIPVAWLQEMFSGLVARNAESRARDEDPSLLPYRYVRMRCPECGASALSLTAVVRDGELLRACRCCRIEFPVDL